jgi:hypothetical protein
MKTSPAAIALALVVLSTSAAVPVEAAELTSSQFRKFRGRYLGEVSGIAGNASLGSAPVGPFLTSLTVSGKRTELLVPMISGLYTAGRHRIVWRKPTGTSKRALLVGVYSGSFTNSVGNTVKVSGSRRLTLRDRGRSFTKRRYVARFADNLTESFDVTGATSAAQDIKGTLLK